MRRAIMVLAAALLAAAPGATAAAESITLRYGQIPSTVRSVSSLYAFIAQQKWFLARENIKLEHVPIPSGTDKHSPRARRGHGRNVTQTASPYLIQAVLAGSDAVAIAPRVLPIRSTA